MWTDKELFAMSDHDHGNKLQRGTLCGGHVIVVAVPGSAWNTALRGLNFLLSKYKISYKEH